MQCVCVAGKRPLTLSPGSASHALAMHSLFGRLRALAAADCMSLDTPQKQSLPALTPAMVSLAAWQALAQLCRETFPCTEGW